jgi:hypothetical protein
LFSSYVAKNNKDIDAFLCNDAIRIGNVTMQGHGGFAMVLDPEGQIKTKSPYGQVCTSFSQSNNRKRFAGGQFVDGFAGRLRGTITAITYDGITSLTLTTAGSVYTAGTYTNVGLVAVNTTTTTGLGAKATIVVGAGGSVSSVTITTAGQGYNYGDVLKIDTSTVITGLTNVGSGFTTTVASTQGYGNGITITVTGDVNSGLDIRPPQPPCAFYVNGNRFQIDDVVSFDAATRTVVLTLNVGTPYNILGGYDNSKSERDLGYILDALRYDLVTGSNFQSIEAGISYTRAYSTVVPGRLKTQCIAAINKAKNLLLVQTDSSYRSITVLDSNSITGGTLYAPTSSTQIYSGISLIPYTISVKGTGATANITVTNGSVTAVTLVTGGNSYKVGDVLYAATGGSFSATGSGFTIKVGSIRADTSINTAIIANAATITNIIDQGVPGAGPITYPDPTGYDANLKKSKDILQANRTFLQNEISSWVADNYIVKSYSNYTATATQTNIGYLVDALIYDIYYGGNSKTKNASDAYYYTNTTTGVSTSLIVGLNAIYAAAITRLKTVLPYILDGNPGIGNGGSGWTKTNGNTETQVTTLPAGAGAVLTAVKSKLDTLCNIVIDYLGLDPAAFDYDTPVTVTYPDITSSTSSTGISTVAYTYDAGAKTAAATILTNKSTVQTTVTAYQNQGFELLINIEMGGNRSMLANDFAMINDLGYAIVVTNGAVSEQVSTFSYYCYTHYWANNGGQIRSIGGSNAHGTYGLRASGYDVTEVPDAVTLANNMVQNARVYKQGITATEMTPTSSKQALYVWIIGYSYNPMGTSELEINHGLSESGLITRYEVKSVEHTIITVNGQNVLKLNLSTTGASGTSSTGLSYPLYNGQIVTLRTLSKNKFNDIANVNPTRPSTALQYSANLSAIYRVLAYGLADSTGELLTSTQAVLESDASFDYYKFIVDVTNMVQPDPDVTAITATLAAGAGISNTTISVTGASGTITEGMGVYNSACISTGQYIVHATNTSTNNWTLILNAPPNVAPVYTPSAPTLQFATRMQGSLPGDDKLSVLQISIQATIDQINKGTYLFGWGGRVFRVKKYTTPAFIATASTLVSWTALTRTLVLQSVSGTIEVGDIVLNGGGAQLVDAGAAAVTVSTVSASVGVGNVVTYTVVLSASPTATPTTSGTPNYITFGLQYTGYLRLDPNPVDNGSADGTSINAMTYLSSSLALNGKSRSVNYAIPFTNINGNVGIYPVVDSYLTISNSRSVSTTISLTAVSTNIITVGTTATMYIGQPLVFNGPGNLGNLVAGITYYVLTIPSGTTLTVSAQSGGTVFTLAAGTGSTSYTFISAAYAYKGYNQVTGITNETVVTIADITGFTVGMSVNVNGTYPAAIVPNSTLITAIDTTAKTLTLSPACWLPASTSISATVLGTVTGISGTNYQSITFDSVPTVEIGQVTTGGSASVVVQAIVTAVLTNKKITSFTIVSPGYGYSSAPDVRLRFTSGTYSGQIVSNSTTDSSNGGNVNPTFSATLSTTSTVTTPVTNGSINSTMAVSYAKDPGFSGLLTTVAFSGNLLTLDAVTSNNQTLTIGQKIIFTQGTNVAAITNGNIVSGTTYYIKTVDTVAKTITISSTYDLAATVVPVSSGTSSTAWTFYAPCYRAQVPVIPTASGTSAPVALSTVVFGSSSTISYSTTTTPLSVGQQVIIIRTSSGTAITGTMTIGGTALSSLEGQIYYVVGTPTATSCSLSLTLGGSAVAIVTGTTTGATFGLGTNGTVPYTVAYTIPSTTIVANSWFYITGATNPLYNGFFQTTTAAGAVTTLTIKYPSDPGTWSGAYTGVGMLYDPHTATTNKRGLPIPFDTSISPTLRLGYPAGTGAQITTRISTNRANSHDFLDIGTGSYSTTNYPYSIYGNPSLSRQGSNEVVENGVGRVFYVSSDQNGIFRVGRYFTVDQGTGTVTFSASIALSNLDGLGFKRGVVVSEFSTDSSMTNNAPDTVPTQSAVRGYIDKRLGIDHSGGVIALSNLIGPGYLALSGALAMKGNMNMAGFNIVQVASPSNDFDAANKTYVDTQVGLYDQLNELRDVQWTNVSTGQIPVYDTNTSVIVTGANGTGTIATLTFANTALSGVTIANTTGRFNYTSGQTLTVGATVVISGAAPSGVNGSITSPVYSNPTTYYVIDTDGATYVQLSASSGGAAITTVATTTGNLTANTFTIIPFLVGSTIKVANVTSGYDGNKIVTNCTSTTVSYSSNASASLTGGSGTVNALKWRNISLPTDNTTSDVLLTYSATTGKIVSAIQAGKVVNAMISSTAAIVQSKLTLNSATTIPASSLSITGYIAATTLTVTVNAGTLSAGMVLSGNGTTAGTQLVALLSGSATSTGTWSVTVSQTVGSSGSPVAITATVSQANLGLAIFKDSEFTASNGWISHKDNGLTKTKLEKISKGTVLGYLGTTGTTVAITGYIASTTLTVTANAGTLVTGMVLSGAGVTNGTVLGSLITGTATATGTWSVSPSQTAGSVGSQISITATSYTANNTDNVVEVTAAAVVAEGNGVKNDAWGSNVGVLYLSSSANSTTASGLTLAGGSNAYSTIAVTSAGGSSASSIIRSGTGSEIDIGYLKIDGVKVLDTTTTGTISTDIYSPGYTTAGAIKVSGATASTLKIEVLGNLDASGTDGLVTTKKLTSGASGTQMDVTGKLVMSSSSSLDLATNSNIFRVKTIKAGTFDTTADESETCSMTGIFSLIGTSRLQATFADLAEYYEGDQEYDEGTVLVFGGDKEVTTTNIMNDTRSAGVVSANPAYVMNEQQKGIKVCIALAGRVPCKVVGRVKKGEMLTTSATPGYAVRVSTPTLGAIIGKALEDKDYGEAGVIQVAVGRV